MPVKVLAFATMGLTIEDIDTEKQKIYGSKVIKEIVTNFEAELKPEATIEVEDASDRLPICTECNASSHLTKDCTFLMAKENSKNDVEFNDSITDNLLGLRIPKKVKTRKEVEPIEIMEEDDDE